MVDTNQDPVEKKEFSKTEAENTQAAKKAPAKTKKDSPQKAAPKPAVAKKKGNDKGVVKKLPVKKDTAQTRGQGGGKAPAPGKKPAVNNIKRFFKGAWSELKKVHWPNRREIITFTGVVLVAVSLVAVMIFAVDSILGQLLDAIIPK